MPSARSSPATRSTIISKPSSPNLRCSSFSKSSVGARREGPLKPAEPVVALVLPIAAGVIVLHPHGSDVFRIFKAELGWNADLDRKAVGGRQGLVIEFERQLGLRMQRGRHVDGIGVTLRALEPDIFGG